MANRRICVWILCACFTFAWSDTAIDGNRTDTASEAVSRASAWVLSQREEDLGWGPLTPRAAVALEMASRVAPLSPDERELLTKQLNVLLTLELGRDVSTKTLTLSRLALFVNSLTATCQDPRDFHGLDLVRILRDRTDSSPPDATLPTVFLSLCMAGEARIDQDLRLLQDLFRKHANKTDLQAIDVMAISCISRQKGSQPNYKSFAYSYLKEFQRRFSLLSPTADVYTLALGLQAIHSGVESADVTSLIRRQLPDGSFGSLLATYLAIPALLGGSLLDLRCRQTDPKIGGFSSPSLPSDEAMHVHFSLWIGEDYDRDSHTVTVTVRSRNITFLDVMRLAEEKNPIFRFHSQETKDGRRVYLIAGIPNDVELELYWMLYRTKDGPNGANPKRLHHPIMHAVDRIFPSPDDHFIFWFRRRSCSAEEVRHSGLPKCNHLN